MLPAHYEEPRNHVASPSKDPSHQLLRRGDLVRISELGIEKSKRIKDRDGYLGRIVKCTPTDNTGSPSSYLYDVDWVLGGRLTGCVREDLVYRTADEEGMTDTSQRSRCKRKPLDFMEDVTRMEKAKKGIVSHSTHNKLELKKAMPKNHLSNGKSKLNATKRKNSNDNADSNSKKKASNDKIMSNKIVQSESVAENPLNSTFPDLFERHSREFRRFFTRLKDKVDLYRHFWAGPDYSPEEYLKNDIDDVDHHLSANDASCNQCQTSDLHNVDSDVILEKLDCDKKIQMVHPESITPPLNWDMIETRIRKNIYVLDRRKIELENRRNLVEDSTTSKHMLPNHHDNTQLSFIEKFLQQSSVLHPVGVNWSLFQTDVLGMCEQGIMSANPDDDDGQRGSISYTVKKIRDELEKSIERFSSRHSLEMSTADDRHYFASAIESNENKEAAMQSWEKDPFPDRRYEKISSDVVCSGLSELDEKIATFELRTNLPDSFIGQSYHYNDTSLSEVWMKSVVDETELKRENIRARNKLKKQEPSPLSKTDEITRAQVNATMQSLLIAVQDRVMTETEVLKQRELETLNWYIDAKPDGVTQIEPFQEVQPMPDCYQENRHGPETIEKPVWGIDCYTRRNICMCLELAFDADIALSFIEKWLLPAINACPEALASNIGNAARILEELPFDYNRESETNSDSDILIDGPTKEEWSRSVLARALTQKIRNSSPPWLKAAANQLRRARNALGPNFFRVHPKGNGSVLLCSKLPANRMVTFYHGELYPSWRWGEKMDAIEITQQRKDLKPALPDFYNMALERPQKDPRGYGLLFVDASRKAGHGSSLSHSCLPTCEVRVAAVNGELCLAMTTLRELECGEELTFDYNAVTESLDEYRSAVCLCGYGKCRGSFLHFATADCYQQILNRNCPIASRFASLVKGSMKKVLSEDDEKVLRCHGFLTAAFGAISVNRREVSSDGCGFVLVDSLDLVPVWLCTYIADALRYIEYERRALPIALVCDNRELHDTEGSQAKDRQRDKEPTLETPFSFFSRTETQLISTLLEKEGLPSYMTGLQRKQALQKVASSYWQGLDEKTRQHWKEQAVADYTKKIKERKNTTMQISSSSTRKRKRIPIQISSEVQICSQISFQGADAEGISAMEQRIQQLSQSLSRIGRVLDRHREQSFIEEPLCDFDKHNMYEAIRNRVNPPLSVLSDEEVVAWIWNKNDGVVHSLMHGVKSSRCVRPQLLSQLLYIKQKYAFLERFGSSKNQNDDDMKSPELSIEDSRSQLTAALLEMRKVILDDLAKMAAAFKLVRAAQSCSPPSLKNSIAISNDISNDLEKCIETSTESDDAFATSQAVSVSKDCSAHFLANQGKPKEATEKNEYGDRDSEDEKSLSSSTNITQPLGKVPELDDWMVLYNERFTLQSSADLLLLYACTSNFFNLNPYRDLESTPIEVYARELGNCVPKSIVDEELENRDDDDVPPVINREASSHSNTPESDCASRKRTLNAVPNQAAPSLCMPDDIVSKVTVKYQGDYVVSQLLNWYNGGIGQKPGMPYLLGCSYLPPMSGCWTSELLETNRRKGERKTAYETIVRPKLIEWFQDQYERGNPWPTEIRRAFVSKKNNSQSGECAEIFCPYGSPILDFLVTGDETNIGKILSELDVRSKFALKEACDNLLLSVDKGRPAQAVSTWVQCESCSKWRKIPWYVDPDILPEKFYCKDNKWNDKGNSCDAPEDDWDDADALVGADGKVEGSPILKASRKKVALSSSDERNFTVGARFDVLRPGKSKYTIGKVVKVDFSGIQKRIQFHFGTANAGREEWIEFGDRIASLHSKVPIHVPKTHRPVPDFEDEMKTDSLDDKCFKIGAAFAARRSDKDHFSKATVSQVDFSGNAKRIKFHFSKTSTCRDEWIDVGSDRIAPISCLESNAKKSTSLSGKLTAARIQKKSSLKLGGGPQNVVGLSRSGTVLDEEHVKICSPSAKRCLTLEDLKQKIGDIDTPSTEESTDIKTEPDNVKVKKTSKIKSNRKQACEGRMKSSGKKQVASTKYNAGIGLSVEVEIGKHVDIAKEENSIALPSEILDQNSFAIGARFDVLRRGKEKFCVGVVKECDFTEVNKKILFHFPKMKCKFDEWIELGSASIRSPNTTLSCQKEPSQSKTKLKMKRVSIGLKSSKPDSRMNPETGSRENDTASAPSNSYSGNDNGANYYRQEDSIAARFNLEQLNRQAQGSTWEATDENPFKYAASSQQNLHADEFSRQRDHGFSGFNGHSSFTPMRSNVCGLNPNLITSEADNIRERNQTENCLSAEPTAICSSLKDMRRQTGSSIGDYPTYNMAPSYASDLQKLKSETAFDKLLLLASMTDKEQSEFRNETLNAPQLMVSQFDFAYGSQVQPCHRFQSAGFPRPENDVMKHSSYNNYPNGGTPPFDRR